MCVPDLSELNLKGIDTIAIDLETYDPDLKRKGSGAIRGHGFVCGIAIATSKQNLYFPIDLEFLQLQLLPKMLEAWNALYNYDNEN